MFENVKKTGTKKCKRLIYRKENLERYRKKKNIKEIKEKRKRKNKVSEFEDE